jgi:hypothetical protein
VCGIATADDMRILRPERERYQTTSDSLAAPIAGAACLCRTECCSRIPVVPATPGENIRKLLQSAADRQQATADAEWQVSLGILMSRRSPEPDSTGNRPSSDTVACFSRLRGQRHYAGNAFSKNPRRTKDSASAVVPRIVTFEERYPQPSSNTFRPAKTEAADNLIFEGTNRRRTENSK